MYMHITIYNAIHVSIAIRVKSALTVAVRIVLIIIYHARLTWFISKALVNFRLYSLIQ